jgi:hypothetical protein
MASTSTVEWAEFALKPGVLESQLRQASAQFQREFLDHRPGFLWRKTVRLAPGRYADLVLWANAEAAKAAMADAMREPACRSYFDLMTVETSPKTGTTIDRYDAPAPWGGLEFSRFRLRDGADPTRLIPAAAEMAQGLYAGRAGFVSHAVLHNGDGEYVDVMLASSRSTAEALCGSWLEDADSGTYAPACREYLSLIEPSSIRLEFWEKLKGDDS